MSNVSDHCCILPMIFSNDAKPGSYNVEVCARQQRLNFAAGKTGQHTYFRTRFLGMYDIFLFWFFFSPLINFSAVHFVNHARINLKNQSHWWKLLCFVVVMI